MTLCLEANSAGTNRRPKVVFLRIRRETVSHRRRVQCLRKRTYPNKSTDTTEYMTAAENTAVDFASVPGLGVRRAFALYP